MQMRIDKVLSQLQIATRSESKKIFQAGRIALNGKIIKNGSVKFDPDNDTLSLDGKPVLYEQFEYYMLNKPSGCVTATEDAHDKTVMEYLPSDCHRRMSPVGRLDKDTEGLLLITDDGNLNHNLLAPGKHVEKTYFARIQGTVTEETVQRFADGLDIGEKKPTAPAKLEILNHIPDANEINSESEIKITITEGKFHQIKRMFQKVGMKVIYLKRLRMGPLVLDETLLPGECRKLKTEEIQLLKSITQ